MNINQRPLPTPPLEPLENGWTFSPAKLEQLIKSYNYIFVLFAGWEAPESVSEDVMYNIFSYCCNNNASSSGNNKSQMISNILIIQ